MKNKNCLKNFWTLQILALVVGLACSCESNREDYSLTNRSKESPMYPETLILTNGVIINGTGEGPICNKSIIIRENRIAAIVDDYAIENLQEGTLIDLNQAFILPGFFNTHVHNQLNESNLKIWAQAGITTVRDLGNGGPTLPYFLGKEQLNQDNMNARLVGSGPLLTAPGGYGQLGLPSVDFATQTVKRLLDEGADLIKLAIEDNLQGGPWPMLSNEMITAITQTAHERAKWVTAHVSVARQVQIAIDCHVNELSHMMVNHLSDKMIKDLIQEDMYWNPTLELWKGTDEMYGASWLPIAMGNLIRFVKGGGKVALGTDFGGYTTPFELGMPITEIKLMAEAGMTPMQIIIAATKNAAKVCGLEEQLGTIESGKIADLLILGSNPLADLEALLEVQMVIKNGSIIAQNDLPNRDLRTRFCPISEEPIKQEN